MARTILALLFLVLGATAAPAQERPADDLRARTERTRRRVETTKVSVRFDRASLDECLTFLHETTGLSVAVSPAAREAATDGTVTLRLRDVTLKSCLELLLAQVAPQLRWTVSGEVLKVDVAADLRAEPRVVLYDVSDVSGRRPNHRAPHAGLNGPDERSGGWAVLGCVD